MVWQWKNIVLSAVIALLPVAAIANEKVYLEFPSLPLINALAKVSETFQVPIAISPSLSLAGTSPEISGEFTLEQLLARLLTDPALAYRISSRGITVTKAYGPSPVTKDEQHSTSSDVELIQVSGYRQPMLLASQAALDAEQFSAYMFADEMGKLPEGSIAEVLARMPGVTISRDAGDGSQVSIRGMDSDDTRVEINDMPALITNATIDSRGAINTGRSFDMNLIPTDMIHSVELRKSPMANDRVGIGGTVALQTPKPLDFANSQARLSVTGQKSELASRTGHGVHGLFAHVNQSRQWGALLAFDVLERPSLEKGFSTVRWAQADWGDLSEEGRVSKSISDELITQLENGELFHSRYNRYDIYRRDFSRSALNISVQWAPTDNWTTRLDLFAGKYKTNEDEYHISSAGLSSDDLSGVSIETMKVIDKDIVAAELTGVDLRTEYNIQKNQTTYKVASMELDGYLSKRTRLVLNAGIQESYFDNPIHQKIYLWSPQQSFSYSYGSHNNISVNEYGVDIATIDAWSLYRLARYADEVDNRFYQLQGSLDYRMSETWQLDFGASFVRYRHQDDGWEEKSSDNRGLDMSAHYRLTPGDFSSGIGLAGLPSQWVVGTQAMIELLEGKIKQQSINESNVIEQEENSVFMMARFDTEVNAMPLRGNLGLRWEGIHRDVSSMNYLDTGYTSESASQDYYQLLPSFNATLLLTEALQLRAAASHNWNHPDNDELTLATSLSVGAQLLKLGNPDLEPEVVDSVDLELSWSKEAVGYVSAALFYKSLDSFIYSATNSVSYADTGLDLSLVEANNQDGNTLYQVTQSTNGQGVTVKGIDIAGLALLPDIATISSGISINYTYNNGNYNYLIEGQRQRKPLVGLSRHTGSVIFFADHHDYGARLVASYRSHYLQSVPSGNGNDEEGVDSALFVDLSMYCNLQHNVRLDLEIKNITDEVYSQYTDSSYRPYTYTLSGREYKLRLNVNF